MASDTTPNTDSPLLPTAASDGTAPSRLEADRYRVFLEDVADGYYETNLRGDFIFFNDAFCRIFGYSRDEFAGRNYREFMDDDNADEAFRSFRAIHRSGIGLVDITWEIIRKDGERRILQNSANLITGAEGEKIGFRGISRDVTEQHQARQSALEAESLAHCLYEASRKAEQRYHAFLRFLPDPVFVFNMDHTVSYLNPAFERTFGWTLAEMEGKKLPFVPAELKEETREGFKRLLEERIVHGFETQRLTRDGRLLDILLSGAVFWDERNEPAGQVVILRDVTREKRTTRTNQALFRIARALHRFRHLEERLEYIARQIQNLLSVEGASVILIDEKTAEFYFHVAAFDDTEAGRKMQEIRFPLDKGVAGHVYRTGEPIIVPDTSQSPYFFQDVDQKAGYNTRNMLDVPIKLQERLIGVLCAVNKKEGPFDADDLDLLGTVANMVALPVENARINDALRRSYEDVRSLSRAKDRVIHHLSHELKTPVSVLSATLGIIKKRAETRQDASWKRVFDRAERNLQRLLDMQYQIEDILRDRDYRTHYVASALLDRSADLIEALVEETAEDSGIVDTLRRHIDTLFGPTDAALETIRLDRFVTDVVKTIRPKFQHRTCRLETRIEATPPIRIPPDVLTKIIEGLVRNAVENTPDGGLIEVTVRNGPDGPVFQIRDTGVGISEENQRLLFENYFTSYDTMQYASKRPYDFNAGGKGFDLLRMKIFSERFDFRIQMTSRRCPHLPEDEKRAPGDIDHCPACRSRTDCQTSGGTTMTVTFSPAGSESDDQPRLPATAPDTTH